MTCKTIGVCAAVFLAATMASAQSKLAISGKCGKPDGVQSVPAGDEQGHSFAISQGKCTAEGKIGGANAEGGAYAENQDNSPALSKNWGVFTVTLDSGDKVYFSYQGTNTMKDGSFAGGTNRWQITGGTGKMKGAKGAGTCKLTGSNDDLNYTCAGAYGTANQGAGMSKQQ